MNSCFESLSFQTPYHNASIPQNFLSVDSFLNSQDEHHHPTSPFVLSPNPYYSSPKNCQLLRCPSTDASEVGIDSYLSNEQTFEPIQRKKRCLNRMDQQHTKSLKDDFDTLSDLFGLGSPSRNRDKSFKDNISILIKNQEKPRSHRKGNNQKIEPLSLQGSEVNSLDLPMEEVCRTEQVSESQMQIMIENLELHGQEEEKWVYNDRHQETMNKFGKINKEAIEFVEVICMVENLGQDQEESEKAHEYATKMAPVMVIARLIKQIKVAMKTPHKSRTSYLRKILGDFGLIKREKSQNMLDFLSFLDMMKIKIKTHQQLAAAIKIAEPGYRVIMLKCINAFLCGEGEEDFNHWVVTNNKLLDENKRILLTRKGEIKSFFKRFE